MSSVLYAGGCLRWILDIVFRTCFSMAVGIGISSASEWDDEWSVMLYEV